VVPVYKKIILILFFLSLSACSSGGGASCDLADPAGCGPDEYCKADIGVCSGSGSCESIPSGCDATVSEVCSCDRLTFFNECYAAQAGQSLMSTGACS